MTNLGLILGPEGGADGGLDLGLEGGHDLLDVGASLGLGHGHRAEGRLLLGLDLGRDGGEDGGLQGGDDLGGKLGLLG